MGGGWRGVQAPVYAFVWGLVHVAVSTGGVEFSKTGHLYSSRTDSRFTAKLGTQVNIFPLTNGGAQRASNR